MTTEACTSPHLPGFVWYWGLKAHWSYLRYGFRSHITWCTLLYFCLKMISGAHMKTHTSSIYLEVQLWHYYHHYHHHKCHGNLIYNCKQDTPVSLEMEIRLQVNYFLPMFNAALLMLLLSFPIKIVIIVFFIILIVTLSLKSVYLSLTLESSSSSSSSL